MVMLGLGDRAQLFISQRHNSDLRTRLATLTQEMSTGRASDMAVHLQGDTAPLADLDRRIALAESYGAAAREAGSRLSLMQDMLGRIEGARAHLLDDLMTPDLVGDHPLAAQSARGAFDDIVSALNTRLGGSAIFAGTAVGSSALATSETIMADLRAAVAGATSADEVAARLDGWFDDPAGSFATIGYLGSSHDMTRITDDDEAVTLTPRADAASLRNILKGVAMASLVGQSPLALPAGESTKLLAQSRNVLLSGAVPLTEARASLGQAQSRADEATARHAARLSAWGVLRNELTQTDPYANASQIEALRTQLETHYEMTSRLSSLSLVSFLR